MILLGIKMYTSNTELKQVKDQGITGVLEFIIDPRSSNSILTCPDKF